MHGLAEPTGVYCAFSFEIVSVMAVVRLHAAEVARSCHGAAASIPRPAVAADVPARLSAGIPQVLQSARSAARKAIAGFRFISQSRVATFNNNHVSS